MRRIYLASSWRNTYQPRCLQLLREWGHEVYDFRNPPPPGGTGFAWDSVDPDWKKWSPSTYRTEKRLSARFSGPDLIRT